MEQAVFISQVENLHYCDENFTRLYFGQEFCERLIPTEKQLERVLSFVEKRNLQLSLVTPYVTNRGLKKTEGIIKYIAKQRPYSEIVFNDWGVFQFLKEQQYALVPVLGRLLTKMKRGPRIMNILDKVPGETKAFFQSSNIDAEHTRNFLKNNRIFRIELDNVLQGITIDYSDKAIHHSLYMPFGFISTTRFCLAANCEDESKRDYIGIFPCKRECSRYTFQMFNPVMKNPLIRKGNTIFFVNENIPDVIAKKQIDRVVIEPIIPL